MTNNTRPCSRCGQIFPNWQLRELNHEYRLCPACWRERPRPAPDAAPLNAEENK